MRTPFNTSLLLLCSVFIGLLSAPARAATEAPPHPNILVIFIDDMGWSDLGCFHGTKAPTPNIDRLASEGLRFTNFYVNPLCSPSRVALSTGQYPQRWRISSYLAERRANTARGMAQWLGVEAPMLARALQKAGYATGHFGKWHMGGQRDVGEAPLITAYGFDRSLTSFEGLGDRVLPLCDAYDGQPPRPHDLGSAQLGHGTIYWVDRSQVTSKFVAAALKFIDGAQAAGKPFYVNLWPDDVHSPFFPPRDLREKAGKGKRPRYNAVLQALDRQLAPLLDRVRSDAQLRDNTLILLCSDNGPEEGAGTSHPLRGSKGWLYEGGVRSPLIVWGPRLMAQDVAGAINDTSILCALDVNRSLYTIAGAQLADALPSDAAALAPPLAAAPRNDRDAPTTAASTQPAALSAARLPLDGEDVSATLLGKSSASRQAPLFWRRPPDRPVNQPAPDLALRDGQWKFYIRYDGTAPELYALDTDPSEQENVAAQHPDRVQRYKAALETWNATLPPDAADPRAKEP